MVIIGYQGIGKSSLVKRKKGFIDLESSNFRFNEKRPDMWYAYYCQVTEDLSSQGYIVFTSSHKEVRDWFRIRRKEKAITISPDKSLKDKWIERLETRYDRTSLEKDYRALMNAKDCYEENVTDIQRSKLPAIILSDINYDLEFEILKFIDDNKDDDFHIRQIL